MTAAISHTLPHWRKISRGGTAQAAAKEVHHRAKSLRVRIIELLAEGPATGEHLHARLLDEGRMCTLYGVKPRLSELAEQGLVTPSGETGRSLAGRKSIRWRLTTPEERAGEAAKGAV